MTVISAKLRFRQIDTFLILGRFAISSDFRVFVVFEFVALVQKYNKKKCHLNHFPNVRDIRVKLGFSFKRHFFIFSHSVLRFFCTQAIKQERHKKDTQDTRNTRQTRQTRQERQKRPPKDKEDTIKTRQTRQKRYTRHKRLTKTFKRLLIIYYKLS